MLSFFFVFFYTSCVINQSKLNSLPVSGLWNTIHSFYDRYAYVCVKKKKKNEQNIFWCDILLYISLWIFRMMSYYYLLMSLLLLASLFQPLHSLALSKCPVDPSNWQEISNWILYLIWGWIVLILMSISRHMLFFVVD